MFKFEIKKSEIEKLEKNLVKKLLDMEIDPIKRTEIEKSNNIQSGSIA